MALNKIKQTLYGASAIALAAAMSMTVFANPLAGITSYETAAVKDADQQTQQDDDEYTVFSGVTQTMNNMLTSSALLADAGAVDTSGSSVYLTAAQADYSDVAIAQVDNYVNVRSTPSEDGEVLGKLYNNSAAAILAVEGDWYKITSGNVTGYVLGSCVVVGNEDLAKSVSRRVATVNTTTLYVRSEASADAPVLGMVPNGEDLTVTDESMSDTGWIKVSVEEGEGYVSTEYVTLSTEYTLAESKAEEEARLAKEEAERKAAAAAAAAKKAAKSSGSSNKSYSAPSGSGGSAVVAYGAQFVGNKYVYGGSSLTNGTDCSGFVMSVYSAFGVSLPHSSSAMRSVGYGVSVDSMQPGDIVCYSGHVGIYAGNGQLLHASNARTGITYSNVYYRNILAVRRIY